MERTPWAMVKLCLPSWLVESAPHKQAFVFFLVMLSPSLFLSPFLLSPLLTLLLLTSATLAGALSAWMTMKLTRTILAHSSPLPPTPISSLKYLVHIMSLKFINPMYINEKFPWIWLWFNKILSSSNLCTVKNQRSQSMTGKIEDPVEEVTCCSEDVSRETLIDVAGDSRFHSSVSTCEEVFNVEKLGGKISLGKVMLEEENVASEEGKEKLSILDSGRGGSVYFRGAASERKGFRPKKNVKLISTELKVHGTHSSISHANTGIEGDNSEVLQILENKKILEEEASSVGDVVQGSDQLLFGGQFVSRSNPCEVKSMKNMEEVMKSKSLESSDKNVIKGCVSHSWCQRGVNLEEEIDLLMEDIHKLCLGKWYPNLSIDDSFPTELKVLLDVCLKHVTNLGSRCDVQSLTVKLGLLFLSHLREFRKARRKKRAAEAMKITLLEDELRKSRRHSTAEKFVVDDESSKNENLPLISLESPKESLMLSKDITKGKEDGLSSEGGLSLFSASRREKQIENIQSSQNVTPPLITPHKSYLDSVLAERKVLESDLGEENYYRFRFLTSRGVKDVPRIYLLNISMYIVKNVIDKVGKLQSTPLECYFIDGESSLADTPPGKVLTSLLARKIILPLVTTISDPKWLNTRIANLLVEYAKAKLFLNSDEGKENLSFMSSEVHQNFDDSDGKDINKTESDIIITAPIDGEKVENIDEVSKDLNLLDERRKSLPLHLEISNSSSVMNPYDGCISTVLGGIISTTAAPLLPDDAKVSYKPIKRMWSSPSIEEGEELDGQPEMKKKMRPFGRNIVDGLPVEKAETLPKSAGDVFCSTGNEEIGGMHSYPTSKDSRNLHRKARSGLSSKNPHKKKLLGFQSGALDSPGTSSQAILFRSKSTQIIQNGKDGTWIVEEGSELHEDACLSDEPLSSATQERDWVVLDWKPNRSRSFHGMKSYSRLMKESKLGKEEKVGDEIGRDCSEKGPKEKDRPMPRVSSEGSVRDHSSKTLEESKAELTEGISTRCMKYALGKHTQWNSEGDSDEMNKICSNYLHSSVEKVETGSGKSSGTSLSEEYMSPDLLKLETKFWSNNDSGNIIVDQKGSSEERQGSDSEERKETTIYHSSPIPSAVSGEESKEIPKDISPVYEEVEDLPSTIAKLKAFLKERNGKIGETTPPPSDEVKKDSDIFPTSDSSQESCDPQKPPSPLEERPMSWPSDGGIFLNVRIPSTEISKSSSSLQMTSTSPNVLYCIEYDAAYPEEGADAAAASVVVGEQSTAEGFAFHQSEMESKDYVANSENLDMVPPSPGTTIHHVLVKRTFQEFLDLHAQFEADPLWRQALKGLKGPSRWLSLPFGKTGASTVAGRRTLLQSYLRGVCTSMPQLASSSKALRTFMAYQGVHRPIVSGGALPSSVERILPLSVEGGEGPVPRIDKLFARTVSGMFNTLRTALPGFDSPETTQAASVNQASSSLSPNPSSHSSSQLDSSSAPATFNESKGSSSNSGTIRGTTIQLPAFLQFGSSNTSRNLDLVDWDMEYGEKDAEGNVTAPGSIEGLPTRNYSLEEDIQAFLSVLVNNTETRTDNAEFAYEALNPLSLSEERKYIGDPRMPSSMHKVLTRQFTVDSADEDGEEEELDAFLPLAKVTFDILCEALRGTGSWVSQGTVVHASKVLIGSFIENKLQEFLDTVTTKEMWCQYIHLLRVAVFHHAPNEPGISSKGSGSSSITGEQLAVAIYTAFPALFRQIVGKRELLEAAKFMADSLQNRVILQDLVLQILHVCAVHLVPTYDIPKELN